LTLQYDPKKADVFAWAFIFYQCLTLNKEPVCRRDDELMVLQPIVLNERDVQGTEFTLDSTEFRLINDCWNSDPSQRPSFVQICETFQAHIPKATAYQLERASSAVDVHRASGRSAPSTWSSLIRATLPSAFSRSAPLHVPLLEGAPSEYSES